MTDSSIRHYDNMIPEYAAETKDGYIVSGDSCLLGPGKFEGIKIVNPSQFFDIARKYA